MRLLLDTHTFLWFVQNDPHLSAKASSLILDPANDSVLSMVSLWEIAIKASIGKLTLAAPYDVFMQRQTPAFEILPIILDHTTMISSLAFPPGHKDPFDRLLIAQAMVEQIPIVSSDPALDQYPITRMW